MKKIIKTIPMMFIAFGVALLLSVSAFNIAKAEDSVSTSSSDPYAICNEISTSQFCKDKNMSLMNIVKTGANVLLFLIGSIAVIMIIYSGFLYLTSMGDASNVKRAKDTLVYAIIGLIVALLAGAIVNFVLSSFTTTKKPTTTTYRSSTSLTVGIKCLNASNISSPSSNMHNELNS